MKKTIQVYIHKGEKFYIAECLDLPVVTQALTLDELIVNIKEALELHLDEENLSDYEILSNPIIMANMELGELIHA